jgi:hypothetical protein
MSHLLCILYMPPEVCGPPLFPPHVKGAAYMNLNYASVWCQTLLHVLSCPSIAWVASWISSAPMQKMENAWVAGCIVGQ